MFFVMLIKIIQQPKLQGLVKRGQNQWGTIISGTHMINYKDGNLKNIKVARQTYLLLIQVIAQVTSKNVGDKVKNITYQQASE